MDVAKYIGLFLLKNNYCCLQGLGNLELKRKPASQQEGQLNAPHYEAILNNTGSIDDALANFIATNESVSIAKASNEIREFIAYAKAELAAGREVLVPSVGKYVQAHNGAIRFELDPAFSMPAKPVAMPAPVRPAPQPQPAVQESSRQSSINWGLIALWGAILLVVGSILFFGIRYMTQQSSSEVAQGAVADSQMVEVVTPPVVDTMATAAADSLAANTPAVSDTPTYNFVISTYKNLAAAQRREKQLNGYGHQVSISSPDSVSFYVIKSMKVMAADTLHLKDSLSKVLNPSGVTILQ